MKPNSSSISSSDATVTPVGTPEETPAGPRSGYRLRRTPRALVPVLLATLGWLALFDVGIALFAGQEPDPRVEPQGLGRYFEYGRSVESKLQHMVRDTPENSAPVTSAGWLATPEGILKPVQYEPTQPSDADHTLVAVYGQSFTLRASRGLPKADAHFETRFLGGPAAPLSHSYAIYETDRGKHGAKVVTLGVLASSLSRLTSLTNMTLWFEEPQPISYPRYVLRDGQLEAIEPVVRSFDDLRDAVHDPTRWQRFVDQLERHDAAYDSLIFEHDLLDYSTVGRAMRRAVGQHHVREFAARYLDAHGFTNRDQILDVAEAIFAKFAEAARADGQVPYVLLFNDLGYGTYLTDALGPRLDRLGIAHANSDKVFDANDPANYVADGHYRPDLDLAFARVWAADLRRLLASGQTEAHAQLEAQGDAQPHRAP